MNEPVTALDHIVWAAPSLESGIARFEELTGARARPGGQHPNHGTHNALTGLGGGVYFEILARDPSLPPGEFSREIAGITEPALMMWAARTRSAGETVHRIQAAGYTPHRFAMSRARPDGAVLRWEIVRIREMPWRGVVPFFIDWLDSPHPSASLPVEATLTRFVVESPQAERLRNLLAALDVAVEVQDGPDHRLVAALATPRGPVTLTGGGLPDPFGESE